MSKNLFFENTESKYHHEMKEKLFNLIIEGKVKIADQNNVEYQIFKKLNKDEFLHMESFIFKPEDEEEYINSAMFSNAELPCIKYFNFNEKDHNLLCDLKGSCGAFENLSCRKCMEINLTDKQKNYISIGFAPDISFGYEGRHIIWLEVLVTSRCSNYKVSYCKEHDITLLEINAKDIEDFKSGTLNFNKLLPDDTQLKEQKLVDDVLNVISKDGYYLKKIFKERFWEEVKPIHTKNYNESYEKFLNKHSLYEIGQFDYDQYVKEVLNIKNDGFVQLIVNKELFDKIIETNRISDELKRKDALLAIDSIVEDALIEIDKQGYIK